MINTEELSCNWKKNIEIQKFKWPRIQNYPRYILYHLPHSKVTSTYMYTRTFLVGVCINILVLRWDGASADAVIAARTLAGITCSCSLISWERGFWPLSNRVRQQIEHFQWSDGDISYCCFCAKFSRGRGLGELSRGRFVTAKLGHFMAA